MKLRHKKVLVEHRFKTKARYEFKSALHSPDKALKFLKYKQYNGKVPRL